MSQQAGYIKDKTGNNKIVLFLFDETTNTLTTASLTSGTNFMDMGILADSTVKIDSSVTSFKDDDLKIRDSNTEYSGRTEATLMQTSKELWDWAYTMRGNKYIEYVYKGIKNGKRQEFFAVVNGDSSANITNPGGTASNKYGSTYVNWSTAVTLSTTQIAAMRTAVGLSSYPYATVTVTIASNVENVCVETTVS